MGSRIRGWIARHRLVSFLALAYAFTWSIQGGLAISGMEASWTHSILIGIGAFGPAIGAAVVVAASGGSLRSWIGQVFKWRIGWRWWLLAIGLPLVILSAGVALFVLGVLPSGFDPTSLGYVAAGVVLSMGILQQDLLDVSPVTRELGREAVLTELDDRVIILDDDRRIVDANRSATTLFEDPDGEALGEPLAERLPELAAALPDEPRQDQFDLSLEHDGEVRHYDVRVSPLYRAYGIVSGLLVSLRDVTERRQREQRLDVLNRLLRHNLRNDLNLVRGNAELLGSSVSDDERHRVDRITETVDGLVATSDKIGRLTDALDDGRRCEIDLRPELDAVVADVRERAPRADISVDCPAGVHVEAGPSLWDALDELVTNAVEHAGNAPSITIRVTDDPADRQVGIDVIDDGPGIGTQEIDAVTGGEETDLRHGSGVGLWLVAWIVRHYGGTIDFAVEDGTTVTIRLPRADGSASLDDHLT